MTPRNPLAGIEKPAAAALLGATAAEVEAAHRSVNSAANRAFFGVSFGP